MPESKTCVVCGRSIEWRKKWERNWDEVKFCSAACRSRKLRPIDHDLSETILALLETRGHKATICPSEAARLVALRHELPDDGWRELMEPTRQAARRLVAEGLVEIRQKARVVDPSTAKGPIRIARAS